MGPRTRRTVRTIGVKCERVDGLVRVRPCQNSHSVSLRPLAAHAGHALPRKGRRPRRGFRSRTRSSPKHGSTSWSIK